MRVYSIPLHTHRLEIQLERSSIDKKKNTAGEDLKTRQEDRWQCKLVERPVLDRRRSEIKYCMAQEV